MEVSSVNYASVFAIEFEKLLRIACEWQNHSVVSNIYVKHMSPKHYFKLYKQQKWTLKNLSAYQVFKNYNSIVSIFFKFVRPSLPLYLLCYLDLLLTFLGGCFNVLLNLVPVANVRLWITSWHSFFKRFRATSHTRLYFIYVRKNFAFLVL